MLALLALVLYQITLGHAPRDGTASLQGEVVYAGDETPLHDVTVETEGVRATTDRQGQYQIVGLTPGEHQMRAHLPGFKTQTQTVSLLADGSTRLDFALRLSKWDDGVCCRVTGVVRDPKGAPVPRARVVFSPVLGDEPVLTAETDRRGRYSIPTDFHVTGEYVAFALWPGATPEPRIAVVRNHQTAREARVDLVVNHQAPSPPPSATTKRGQQTAAIHGQVLALAGEPIFGATLAVLHERSGTIHEALVDAHGTYRMDGLFLDDRYLLTATAPRYTTEMREVYVAHIASAPVDFALLRDLRGAEPGCVATGTVRDSTGTALEGVAVTFLAAFRPDVRARGYSDATGSFTARLPQPGVYVAHAHKRGQGTDARALDVAFTREDVPCTVDLTLRRH